MKQCMIYNSALCSWLNFLILFSPRKWPVWYLEC